MTIIIFIIVLAILIFVHEFGHFIMARAFGIKVNAFALGFGPKIFSWRSHKKNSSGEIVQGETEYSLRIIPFGGYVKIYGEDPNEENINGPDAARSFVHKKRWQQAIVLAAGVLGNFIFAWLLYTIVFTTGVAATAGDFGSYEKYLSNERIMVTDVMKNSPASLAGIEAGDVITGFSSIDAVQQAIQNSDGRSISINITSHGKTANVNVAATKDTVEATSSYRIGIAMDTISDLHLPLYISVWEGLKYTGMMIRDTTVGLIGFIVHIVTGSADFSQISGPVGIAGIVGDAASLGMAYLVMITAIISINLGVINLVPFPALDGGRIVVVAIESVIRRRVTPKYINIINTVGFILLMALMVLVTYKDIAKLII